jgi:hypothetical protein
MAKAELLFVGTDTGLLQFSNPGGIGRWLRSGHSLPGSDIVAVWAKPDDPTHVLCSDAEHLYESTDGGQHWSDPIELGITAFAPSRTTPTTILARTDSDAILSTDSGAQWRRIGTAERISVINDRLAISTETRAHTSPDGGTSWQPDDPWAYQVASHDGLHTVTCTTTGNWIVDDAPIAAPPIAVRTVAVCAGTPARVIGSDGSALWIYDTDWQHSPDAPGLVCIAPTPYHPDRLWGADAHGTLWYSATRGSHWEAIKTQLGSIHTIVPARLL